MKNKQKQLHVSRINQVMARFTGAETISVEEAINLLSGVEDDLKALLPEYQAMEGDYRLGNETYGYQPEGILLNLQYLSDRWGAAFRIAWLLGLVDEEYR